MYVHVIFLPTNLTTVPSVLLIDFSGCGGSRAWCYNSSNYHRQVVVFDMTQTHPRKYIPYYITTQRDVKNSKEIHWQILALMGSNDYKMLYKWFAAHN